MELTFPSAQWADSLQAQLRSSAAARRTVRTAYRLVVRDASGEPAGLMVEVGDGAALVTIEDQVRPSDSLGDVMDLTATSATWTAIFRRKLDFQQAFMTGQVVVNNAGPDALERASAFREVLDSAAVIDAEN